MPYSTCACNKVTSLVLFTACSTNQNWPGKTAFSPQRSRWQNLLHRTAQNKYSVVVSSQGWLLNTAEHMVAACIGAASCLSLNGTLSTLRLVKHPTTCALPVPATKSQALFCSLHVARTRTGLEKMLSALNDQGGKSSAPHSSEQIFSSCFITGLAAEHCRTHGCSLHLRFILS